MNDEIASLTVDAFSSDQEAASPSSHLLDERALHGYRPLDDEPDPRPLPASDPTTLALDSAVEALAGLFLETRLEPDLQKEIHGNAMFIDSPIEIAPFAAHLH